jgi:hypothetical protein
MSEKVPDQQRATQRGQKRLRTHPAVLDDPRSESLSPSSDECTRPYGHLARLEDQPAGVESPVRGDGPGENITRDDVGRMRIPANGKAGVKENPGQSMMATSHCAGKDRRLRRRTKTTDTQRMAAEGRARPRDRSSDLAGCLLGRTADRPMPLEFPPSQSKPLLMPFRP